MTAPVQPSSEEIQGPGTDKPGDTAPSVHRTDDGSGGVSSAGAGGDAGVRPGGEPPAWRSRRCVALFVGLAVSILAADLVIKVLAFRYVAGTPVVLSATPGGHAIPPHDPIPVVPHVLSLRLTVNRGAVFGLAQGGVTVFAVVSVVAIAAILYGFFRTPRDAIWMQVALAMLLAGAVGNLFDRVAYAGVRDMFYLFPGVRLPFGWTWPGGNPELYPWIFNLADVSLVGGVLLFGILAWFTPEDDPHPAEPQERS